jgi:hypothetical protein
LLGLFCYQQSSAALAATEQIANAPAKVPVPNAFRPELILQCGHMSAVDD